MKAKLSVSVISLLLTLGTSGVQAQSYDDLNDLIDDIMGNPNLDNQSNYPDLSQFWNSGDFNGSIDNEADAASVINDILDQADANNDGQIDPDEFDDFWN